MSDSLVTIKSADEPTSVAPHLVPCEISYTGPAPVSMYFKPRAPAAAGGASEAALGGRPRRGRARERPDGVRGAVLQDTVQASVADGEERRGVHTGSFDALTYWKHDDAPTAHDAAARTLEWVKLAQVLHAEHADEAAPPIEHRTSVEAS